MAGKMGFKAKAYYLSTGTRATWGTAGADGIHSGAAPASLTEIGNCRELTLNLSKDEGDASTRGNAGWHAILPALKSGQVQWTMVYDPADATYSALFKAFLTDAAIAMAFLDDDKATVGTQGLWADFHIIGFEKSEPLKDAQTVQVTIKPAYSAVPPEWVKVP